MIKYEHLFGMTLIFGSYSVMSWTHYLFSTNLGWILGFIAACAFCVLLAVKRQLLPDGTSEGV